MRACDKTFQLIIEFDMLPIGKQCGDPAYSWPSNFILVIKIVILSSLEGAVTFSNSVMIKNLLDFIYLHVVTKHCIIYHY